MAGLVARASARMSLVDGAVLQRDTFTTSRLPSSAQSKAASQSRVAVDIAGRAPNLTILERTVNGQPSLVLQQDGVTVAVMAFDVAGDRIKHIWAVLNPEKLRPWTTG